MKNKLLLVVALMWSTSLAMAQARNDRNPRNGNEGAYESVIENSMASKDLRNQRFGEMESAARGRITYQSQNGSAEVFIRIATNNQQYSVEIGDQMITNRNGYFRFFDVPNVLRMPIVIRRNNMVIFQGNTTIRNQTRYVLDFDGRTRNLYLLSATNINSANSYYDWNNVWNSYYDNNNNGGNFNYGPPMMNNQTFNSFITALKKANFSKSQMEMVRTQATLNSFSSHQIASICSEFSFDKDRLDAAKLLYNSCNDKENYFVVGSTFSFDSYKRDLQQFIQNQNRR